MLTTYSVYIYILVVSSLLSFCYQYAKSHFKVVIWWTLLFVLWIPAAIRFGVGTDYFRYISMVDSVKLGYISTELGYYLINLFVVHNDINPQWAIVISSFLIVYFCLKSMPKNYFFFSCYVFVCTFYLPSFSLIRQAIAIGLIAYGVYQYIHGNKYIYLIMVICASFFHLSALILLPFYILSKFTLSTPYYLLGIVVTVLVVFSGNTLVLLLNNQLLLNSKYGFYASSEFAQDAQIGSGIGVLMKMFIPFLCVIYSKNIKNGFAHSNILIWISVGCVTANICSFKIHIFSRVADVFLFTSFIAVPYLVSSIHKKVYKQVVVLVIIVMFFAFFVRTIQANYNNDQGGIGISPYYTIFDK